MSSFLEEIVEKVRQHPRLVIAEDYELAIQRVSSRKIKYRNGVEALQTRESHNWVSLRILHRKQPGRAVMNLDSADWVPSLVENAFESSQRSSPDPWFRFPIWKSTRPPEIASLSAEDDFDSLFPEIPVTDATLEENYESWDVVTRLVRKTERIPKEHRRHVNALRFSLFCGSDDSFFSLHERRAQSRPLQEKARWLASLLHQGEEQKRSHPFSGAARSSVLLSPQVVSTLLEQMAPWFFGDRIQEGKTPLGEPRPSPLFASCLTLVDNGLLPGGANTSPFDLEGCAAQETTIIDKGIFRQPLLDTYTATRENRLSTGNFLRDFRSNHPKVGISNLYLQPSATSVGDLVATMAEGLVLETLERCTPTEEPTRFLLEGRGWRVAAGSPVQPLHKIRFFCRIDDLLRQAVGVGNDLTFYGACGGPSILCEDLPLDL